MTHFPLIMNIKDREIIIFGGGSFALQRIEKLQPFLPKLHIISETISNEIKRIDGIEWQECAFRESNLDTNPAFVIIAESEEKTKQIYSCCKKRHIPVNAVDMPKYCDIIFPSIVSTEHLCISISTGGISPTATVEFKEKIEDMIPDNIDEILEWMLSAKEYVSKVLPKEKRNRALQQLLKAALSENRSLVEAELKIILESL